MKSTGCNAMRCVAGSRAARALAMGFLSVVFLGVQAVADTGVSEESLPSPEAAPFLAGAPLNPPESEDMNPSGLRAEPAQLTFRTRDAEGRVQILRNGEPVPGDQISDVRALVGRSNYSHMFRFRVSDEEPGTLVISGHPQNLEIGVYDVHFRVGGDESHVRVRAPLDQEPDSLERQAEQRAITIRELLREKGLTQRLERGEIRIRMPEHFHEGQVMRIALDDSPGRHFRWMINGDVVLEGENANVLSHALTEPGAHTLRVEELSNGNVLAQWEGEFRVVPEEPIEWTIRENQPVELPAPEGFEEYTWRIDGVEAQEGPVFEYTFDEPGAYTVECVAREPEEDVRRALRRVTWEITVEPRQ